MSIEAMKLALEALEWDYVGDKHQRKQGEAITALRQAIDAAEQHNQAQKQEPVEVWRNDAPPKRGVYRVKRGAQRGFSFWNGERWGMLCSSRPYAVEIRDMGRKTPSKYQMYWLHKAAHGIMSLQDGKEKNTHE